MADLKLTEEKLKVYKSDDEKGVFKTTARLEKLGENQNRANELLAANIYDLIKRVCLLEDQQVNNNEVMKKIAQELSSFKTEIDRLKLTSKLNTNAIDRLNNAINLAEGNSEET